MQVRMQQKRGHRQWTRRAVEHFGRSVRALTSALRMVESLRLGGARRKGGKDARGGRVSTPAVHVRSQRELRRRDGPQAAPSGGRGRGPPARNPAAGACASESSPVLSKLGGGKHKNFSALHLCATTTVVRPTLMRSSASCTALSLAESRALVAWGGGGGWVGG
jgi:hypothetical protein